ncbi:MAG TPA: aminoglycoside phosphotransferase family protein [Kineosporiaceae bacterium]|nr:aminoglycoside phosphotransferase family protein [Kineosporiaceae bacterium]
MNAHRRFLAAEDLQKILVHAGIDSPLTEQSLLTGGTYNSVYRLSFADRSGVVLKLSPDPRGAVMTYEQGIVKTEALFYAMAQDQAALPVPMVIALLDLDLDLGGGQALLVTELPGVPWFGSGVSGSMRGPLRAELGRLMASMHAVPGPAFGYPSESTGALTARWFEAFAAMLDAVLDDADRYRAMLPVDPRRVRRALNACVDDLDAVLVPSLVHFDLWDGNVLIDLDGPPRISGLIDGERAMWGDPVMDFASAALFGEIRDDEDFIRGYQTSGAVLPLHPSGRRRLLLYRIYLGLIMTVEPIPRGYGQAERKHAARVTEQLIADLAELDQLTGLDPVAADR